MTPQVAAVLIASALLAGCATVVEGTSQSIAVDTEPAGAACRFSQGGQMIGAITNTPGSLAIRKKYDGIDVTCEKPGYQNATAHIRADFAAATVGNVLIGGIVGVILDASTAAAVKYDSSVRLVMVAADPSEAAAAVASGTLTATPAARPAPPRPSIMFGDSVEFRCPAPRTEIGFRSGAERVFVGADDASCRYEGAGGPLPVTAFGTDAAGAKTLQRLWPLSVGREVSFSTNSTDANGITATQETYRVMGHEVVTVAAGSFDCFVIEREATITGFRLRTFEHSQYWYAPEVGYVVKTVTEVRGRSTPEVSADEAVRIVAR